MTDDVTRLRDTVALGGGPAFPQSDLTAYGMGPSESGNNSGMSLRDWYAGQAMSALAEGAGNAMVEGRLDDVIPLIAKLSWRLADAMLRERFRR